MPTQDAHGNTIHAGDMVRSSYGVLWRVLETSDADIKVLPDPEAGVGKVWRWYPAADFAVEP